MHSCILKITVFKTLSMNCTYLRTWETATLPRYSVNSKDTVNVPLFWTSWSSQSVPLTCLLFTGLFTEAFQSNMVPLSLKVSVLGRDTCKNRRLWKSWLWKRHNCNFVIIITIKPLHLHCKCSNATTPDRWSVLFRHSRITVRLWEMRPLQCLGVETGGFYFTQQSWQGHSRQQER